MSVVASCMSKVIGNQITSNHMDLNVTYMVSPWNMLTRDDLLHYGTDSSWLEQIFDLTWLDSAFVMTWLDLKKCLTWLGQCCKWLDLTCDSTLFDLTWLVTRPKGDSLQHWNKVKPRSHLCGNGDGNGNGKRCGNGNGNGNPALLFTLTRQNLIAARTNWFRHQ